MNKEPKPLNSIGKLLESLINTRNIKDIAHFTKRNAEYKIENS